MSAPSAWKLLAPRGRLAWRVAGLAVLTLAMAVLEAAGVGSIAPLVLVLQSPEGFAATRAGQALAGLLGSADAAALVPAAVGAVAILFTAKACVTLAQGYAAHRFAQALYADLSTRILAGYLAMPFSRHAATNSAVLQRNVTTETRMIVDSIVLQTITAAAEILVITLILLVLVWLNPAVALGAFLAGAVALGLGAVVIRRVGAREGRAREETQAAMLKLAQSALSGIREVKIAGAEKGFIDRFATAAARHGHAVTVVGWMQVVPRVALEAVAILVVLGVFLRALMTGTEAATLPLLAVYLAAGYRLLPSLNRLYVSGLMIHYAWAGFRAVAPGLTEALAAADVAAAAGPPPSGERLAADGLGYTYPGAERKVLGDVSIAVGRGEMIGIVGASGAGKTTLVNLLLGLLAPAEGTLLLDGAAVTTEGERARLRAAVAYVAQAPFVADDTLRANITLGAAALDAARLAEAVRLAQLDALVASLPQGLDTEIGERAARLSGGEAQRIGIARALYLDRPILVLDEATSALDPATEAALLAALGTLRGERAIIAISHKPEALAGCDRVYRVADGTVTLLPSP
ncbi:ABC transporter ATP-binding protein [Elioraea sp.]|uniref:ATP-binding cassette domain-containing protein n=1 Tax=Elioraea sp. TaxID=2185103 RepID=UPI0025C24E65|nr:ABC transporter ATP-binding protein [Elioraea sp.]